MRKDERGKKERKTLTHVKKVIKFGSKQRKGK